MRSSSTRPSSIAAAASPAPPIETSLSVASSAAATSSATEPSASRAFPSTLSSVRLKTTFGIAHQTSANADLASLSRRDGSVSHTKQLLARGRPLERALAVRDKAVHRNAHRVDQHGYRALLPSAVCSATGLVTDREAKTHRRGRAPRLACHNKSGGRPDAGVCPAGGPVAADAAAQLGAVLRADPRSHGLLLAAAARAPSGARMTDPFKIR